MKCSECLTTDDPIALCRAGSAYISAEYSGSCMFGLNLCECVSDVLEVVTGAYERLPHSEQIMFAPTLLELVTLASIERALELQAHQARHSS